MQIISKLWNNFKTQPDIWFFYGFLLTFTLSIRNVFTFFPILDNFNEYTGFYLYLSDIFLILTLIAWGSSMLYNKNILLSIDRLKKWYVLLPLLIVAWAFLSVSWANNEEIALFRSIKLLEFFLLYLFVIFRVENCSTWNNLFKIIMVVGVFHSIIAILQFIFQKSIGFFWLKESLISSDILGVAKIIVDGEKIVRSYGLFPHPNILGGFLLFSIVITILYRRMFHPSTNVPRGTLYGAGVEHYIGQAWNIIVLCLELLALFLTFSKSAIIGLGLALLYLFFINVPRGTFMVHLKKQAKWLLLGILLALTFLFVIRVNLNIFFTQSLEERGIYQNVSRGTISNNLILGVGNGQFVLGMQDYLKQLLDFWQFQPVHNVYLLIWSELGLVGFILLLFWILKTVCDKNVPSQYKCSTSKENKFFHPDTNVPRGTFYWTSVEQSVAAGQARNILWDMRETFVCGTYFKAILLGLMFIMLFDHYLWDIQQGQILLWMTLGFVVGLRKH